MAIKERPNLIVSDVMMPKISGFDMLDILRSTTETKDIKVIMMTALSSEDQRQRGEKLGADRYLVKSQVGIEDVVRTVHEVLGDLPGMTPSPAAPQPQQAPAAPAAQPAPSVAPQPAQQAQTAPSPAGQAQTAPSAMPTPSAPPTPAPAPAGPQPVAAQPPRAANLSSRVIQPLSPKIEDQPVDLSAMMEDELSGTPTSTTPDLPQAPNYSQSAPQTSAAATPAPMPPAPITPNLPESPELPQNPTPAAPLSPSTLNEPPAADRPDIASLSPHQTTPGPLPAAPNPQQPQPQLSSTPPSTSTHQLQTQPVSAPQTTVVTSNIPSQPQ